ncbi:class I SAM-dependent methyltransferase [Candidatus Leptofilum sp.]|uniref:class I SAM-dependent methyltransferase n=1 Tax=Candidatus Leptofilum sp. TaxID=3241576 RepID=UPI003B5CDBCD
MNNTDTPPVCDYEGSDYRTRFWEGQGRNYEDQVERIALRRLMPPTGGTLIEIGAGFGRLADEYLGYQKVVLFDYSRSLLREAQAHLGDDPRFVYVAGNWYQMPFVAGLFDTMVQIRTLHHAADVPALFQQLARIARPNGRYILEFANKQNLKAILRYGLRRQDWSPLNLEPIEFVALNFDFHPRWIRQQLAAASFKPGKMLTVSHFRIGVIKRTVPTRLLAGLDSLMQHTGNWLQLSPSVFVDIEHPSEGETAAPTTFFACPHCQTALPEPVDGRLICPNSNCQRQWAVEDNLYDFKEPV